MPPSAWAPDDAISPAALAGDYAVARDGEVGPVRREEANRRRDTIPRRVEGDGGEPDGVARGERQGRRSDLDPGRDALLGA